MPRRKRKEGRFAAAWKDLAWWLQGRKEKDGVQNRFSGRVLPLTNGAAEEMVSGVRSCVIGTAISNTSQGFLILMMILQINRRSIFC